MTESGKKLVGLPILIDKSICLTALKKSGEFDNRIKIDPSDYYLYLVVEEDWYCVEAYLLITREEDASIVQEEFESNNNNVIVVPLN